MKVAELAQMIVPDVYDSELRPPIAVWWVTRFKNDVDDGLVSLMT